MVVELLVEMDEIMSLRDVGHKGHKDKVKSQDIRVYSSYRVCVCV